MKLFLDTANIDEISELLPTGAVYGITTNPSIIRKQFAEAQCTKEGYYEALELYLERFARMYDGLQGEGYQVEFPVVNLEIFSRGKDDSAGYVEKEINAISDIVARSACKDVDRSKFAIKIPLTRPALVACHKVKQDEAMVHPINVTLCFSEEQAMMAAEAGADFISLFVGRLHDNGIDGNEVVDNIVGLLCDYYDSQLLVASIRNVDHVREAIFKGADAATMPCSVFKELYENKLTDAGLQKFCEDWAGK
jgi:transaldolase